MLIYWLWLALLDGISEREKLAVLAHFDDPEDCYFASDGAYAAVEGLRPEAAAALERKDLEIAETVLAQCAKKKIRILTIGDPQYPAALKHIPDAPVVLYCRGVLPDFDAEPIIGVVGTRKASAYGLNTARLLGGQIAAHGGIVVSGMAEGVDAMATAGALEAGKTAVGILGCGVDRIYPQCNRALFRKMEQQGCLISEYPPGAAPDRWHFPRRNRIISGLSCGVLVVEAPEKSGSLITARQALEQGRDVFVVPGNIGVATCVGSNALLRDGAIAVTSGWDVLSEYVCRYPDKILEKTAAPQPVFDKKPVDNTPVPPYSDLENNAAGLDPAEQAILASLRGGEQLIDTVIAETGLPSGEVLAALTMLEVQGIVTTRPGGWVSASQIH